MAMLTPNKIKGYQFQQAGRGTYRAEEVDDFLGQIVESYEQVFKENGELVKKLSILATKLDEYRREETSVRKALANAQNFIDKLVEDANNEAKKIVSDAQERAKNIDSITNAKIKVMVDEVEGKMRIAYEKATALAKQTKDNAQKDAETILLEAREKADKMVADAKKEATTIISGATSNALKDAEELRLQIEKEKEILDSLKATSNQFKTELVVLYERQIKNVEQMPDYVLDKKLEETVKQIVEDKNDFIFNQEEIAVDETVEDEEIAEEVVETEEVFDADDLISEYASMNISSAEDYKLELDVEDYDDLADDIPDEFAQIDAEDDFAFDLDKEKIEDETLGAGEQESNEEIDESNFSYDFSVNEKAETEDEYEDIFSDSGSSESFRFTTEDVEDINSESSMEEIEEEDIDIFSDEAEDEGGIYIGRTEPQRKLDIAFSDADAVEIDKDENLFLNQNQPQEEVKVEKGFRLFDNIDFSDNDSFEMEKEDIEVDTDDVFDAEEDDDSEGFSFLRNIFGKNKD